MLTGVFVFHSLRSQNPLLNVRLYANRAFAAASATTFFLGASLFGAMILLPLYFQVVRGDSVVRTGVLLIPQSLGAAFAMPIAGRLADRYGGGPIALIGVIVSAVSTLPLAFVTPGTPLWEIEASLLARGLGIGLAMMPAMSAAYAVLRPEQIADATPQLTVVQRVGGSIGTAVLAVVLGTALTGATGPAATSAAFASAYWWAFGLSVVAVIPALILLQAERRSRRFQFRAALPGRHRGGARGSMTAAAPETSREAALEELRLALQEMLSAHRRLRSRDSRVTGTIGLTHFRLLSELRREGALTASHLAQAADLAPATVTEMLDALVGAGLVERVRDTDDRRVVRVSLTPSRAPRGRRQAGAVRQGLGPRALGSRRRMRSGARPSCSTGSPSSSTVCRASTALSLRFRGYALSSRCGRRLESAGGARRRAHSEDSSPSSSRTG